MMKTKNSVTNLLCILLISFGYVGYAQNSKPSYEWIGSYNETLTIGRKSVPWGLPDWWTDYERVDNIYTPLATRRSDARYTKFYRDTFLERYGFKASVQGSNERQDGTYWRESWNVSEKDRKINYHREDDAKFFSAELPSCIGEEVVELAPLCKLTIVEKAKVFVTADSSQVGRQKWDVVFHMTTQDGESHACTKQITLSGPSTSGTVSPCKSFLWFGNDCYNRVEMFKP